MVTSALFTALFIYPAESLADVIPKPMQGLIGIAFFTAVFIVMIFILLRCGKTKRKIKPLR